jgi:hypothetical protein
MTQRQVGFLVGLPFVLVLSATATRFRERLPAKLFKNKNLHAKQNVPDQLSHGTFVEQPSPEVCS